MVGINLEGVWRLARAAVPALLASAPPRRGRFVAVASAGASVGLPLLTAYTAAKAGVVGPGAEPGRRAGAPRASPPTPSPPARPTRRCSRPAPRSTGWRRSDEFAVHHLLQGLVTADQVAALVAWLCGEASGAVTGALLPVDAGMTAR